ncbi:MAG TPA: LamG domain-containing protein [Baekduia sp.]|jgi:hypothetical protein
MSLAVVAVRWSLVMGIGALLAGPAPAQAGTPSRYAAAVEATPGLQHYLRLGDSGAVATDLGPATRFCHTGPSRYGAQVTLGLPGALPGDPDTAAGFDGATPDGVWGSSIRVACGPVPDWGQYDPFTMEAWIRPGRLDGNSRRILAREDANGGTIVAARSDGLVFSRFIKAHDVYVWDPDPSRARTIHWPEQWATLTTPVTPGIWTHVVAAYDGIRMSLIVNGRLAAQKTTSIPVNNSNLRIGANENGYLEWDGLIDEAATYSTGLTVTQAAAHYAAGIGP